MITTVIAEALSETAEKELTRAARSDEDRLLQAIASDLKASMADLAQTLGWFTSKGEPHKSKVHRALNRLKAAKLVAAERGEYMIADKGAKLLKRLTENGNVSSD